jgi:hypothetical protein
MTREDYMFTLGYNGNQAMIDKTRLGKYKKCSLEELCDKGQYKAAICKAFWDDDQSGLELVLQKYNQNTVKPLGSVEVLKRAFGVMKLPESIKRTVYL